MQKGPLRGLSQCSELGKRRAAQTFNGLEKTMIQLVRTLAIRKTIKRPTEFARYAFREARQDLDACITIQTELFQLVRLDESTNMMGTSFPTRFSPPSS